MLQQVNGPYGKICFTKPLPLQPDYANHSIIGISSTSMVKQPENWAIFYKHLIHWTYIIPIIEKAFLELSMHQ